MEDRWDKYYKTVCESISTNSKCYSRRIGSILVRDRSIIATGYNGPPRGIPHCGKERLEHDEFLRTHMFRTIEPRIDEDLERCPRRAMNFASGDGLMYCIAAHAEQNCVANAARMGVATLGSTLYMNDQIPCKVCLAVLINAGIKEIVVTRLNCYDPEGEYLANYSGIKIRDFEGRRMI